MTHFAKPQLFDRIRDLFRLNTQQAADHLHPDFIRYFGGFFQAPERLEAYLDEVRYIARVGAFSGHVLDLAAGFGLTALCLRTLGVEKVSCLDLVETKVSTARKLAEFVQADGVDFQLGDATELSFEDNSFDGVLIKDAASHFRHPEKVSAEVLRVLRHGARLVILDDRNALNEAVRVATQGIWEASETGSAEELARLGQPASFTQLRHEYIRQRFGELDEETAAKIAGRTRGYTFRMMDEIVPKIAEGKDVTLHPAAPCIHPGNEIVQERLIDPLELASQLNRSGFRSGVVPPTQFDSDYWRRRGGGWKGIWQRRLIRLLWPSQRLWPRWIRNTPDFVVVAVKR